jgi:hypothetical protein
LTLVLEVAPIFMINLCRSAHISTEYAVSNIPHTTGLRKFHILILLWIQANSFQTLYINSFIGSSETDAVLSLV